MVLRKVNRLLGHLLSQEGLTFNWNTNGAGYVDAVAGLRIYALNRTGALPISYLTGGTNSTTYEKDAYNWFAEKTYDPNLARVVQYAALYQIFHEFRIRVGLPIPVPNKQPKTTIVAGAIAIALMDLHGGDCSVQSIVSHSPKNDETHRLMHLLGVGDLEHSCQLLNAQFSQYGEAGVRTLAAVLAAGRQSDADLKLLQSIFSRKKEDRDAYVDSLPLEKRRRLDAILISQELTTDREFRQSLAKRLPLEKARDMYATGAARSETGWIHTASVVVSWPIGEVAHGTGGHNLDAKIGRFVEDSSVKDGEIRIVREQGERVIHYNPVDRIRLPEWLHDAAVAKDDATLLANVKKTFRIPPDVPPDRDIPVALKFDGATRTERGLTRDLAGPGGFDRPGWGETIPPTTREAAATRSLQGEPARVLSVERLENGYYRVLEGQTGRVYQARSITDVMDTVVASLKRAPGKPPTTLVLAGFEEGDAFSFRRTAETWMQREGLPQRRVSSVRLVDESVTADQAVRPLREQGDLLRARFGEWQLKDATLSSGKSGKVYETTIEVPAKVGGFKGFFLKIRVYFESLFPSQQELMTTEARAKALLADLPEDATAGDAAAAFEMDLRSKFSDLHSVAFELSGIVTVQREQSTKLNAYSPAD